MMMYSVSHLTEPTVKRFQRYSTSMLLQRHTRSTEEENNYLSNAEGILEIDSFTDLCSTESRAEPDWTELCLVWRELRQWKYSAAVNP